MRTLDEIAAATGTDKRRGMHGYTKYYDMHFSTIRHDRIRLLEFGVFNGASLKMWEEYFSQGDLTAIDINPECAQYATERSKVIIGSQTDDIGGAYDIIIDDGSHLNAHQWDSFKIYWPRVKCGGWYIIEDTHVAWRAQYNDPRYKNIMELIDMQVRLVNYEGTADYQERDAPRRIALAEVHVYPGIVFLRKDPMDWMTNANLLV